VPVGTPLKTSVRNRWLQGTSMPVEQRSHELTVTHHVQSV